MTGLPVEMVEAAASGISGSAWRDGLDPRRVAESALVAAGVPALLEERDRLRAALGAARSGLIELGQSDHYPTTVTADEHLILSTDIARGGSE